MSSSSTLPVAIFDLNDSGAILLISKIIIYKVIITLFEINKKLTLKFIIKISELCSIKKYIL